MLENVNIIFPVTERGFFCDDLSLMLPYKTSTIPNSFLIVNIFSAPALVSMKFSFDDLNSKQFTRFGSLNYLFVEI